MSSPLPVKASSGSLLSGFVSKVNLICTLWLFGAGSALCDIQNTGKFPLFEKVFQEGRLRGTGHLSNLPLVLKSRLTWYLKLTLKKLLPHLPSTCCFQNLKETAKLLLQCIIHWQVAQSGIIVTVTSLPPTTDKKIVKVGLITHTSVSSCVK